MSEWSVLAEQFGRLGDLTLRCVNHSEDGLNSWSVRDELTARGAVAEFYAIATRAAELIGAGSEWRSWAEHIYQARPAAVVIDKSMPYRNGGNEGDPWQGVMTWFEMPHVQRVSQQVAAEFASKSPERIPAIKETAEIEWSRPRKKGEWEAVFGVTWKTIAKRRLRMDVVNAQTVRFAIADLPAGYDDTKTAYPKPKKNRRKSQ